MKCFKNSIALRICPSPRREPRPFLWLEPRPHPWGGSAAHSPEGFPSTLREGSTKPSEVSCLSFQAADRLGNQDPRAGGRRRGRLLWCSDGRWGDTFPRLPGRPPAPWKQSPAGQTRRTRRGAETSKRGASTVRFAQPSCCWSR